MSKKQEMPNTGYAIIRCDDGVIVARLTSFPVCERALMYRRGDTVLKWSTKTGHRVRVFPVSVF
ncbi:hypothetical protein V6120_00005 [Klebsiella pneumoniae]